MPTEKVRCYRAFSHIWSKNFQDSFIDAKAEKSYSDTIQTNTNGIIEQDEQMEVKNLYAFLLPERKNEMTIYQKELLKQLYKLNCTGQIDDTNGMLHISLNGIPLCSAAKSAELYWSQEKLITEEHINAVL